MPDLVRGNEVEHDTEAVRTEHGRWNAVMRLRDCRNGLREMILAEQLLSSFLRKSEIMFWNVHVADSPRWLDN
eukprot:4017857-Pleurochrysis_carterae.AAC.1